MVGVYTIERRKERATGSLFFTLNDTKTAKPLQIAQKLLTQGEKFVILPLVPF